MTAAELVPMLLVSTLAWPWIGGAVLGWGWFTGRRTAAQSLAVLVAAVTLGSAVLCAVAYWGQDGTLRYPVGGWLAGAGWSNIAFDFVMQFDPLTAVGLVATSASGLAVMALEPHVSAGAAARRQSVLALLLLGATVVFMTAGHFLQLFVGWQMMTVLASRLLTEPAEGPPHPRGATWLLLTGLFADIAFIVSLLETRAIFGTYDLERIFALAPILAAHDQSRAALGLISSGLVIATVGRCGLFPLFAWLQELPHRRMSTIAWVCGIAVIPSGLFLLLRCHPLLAAAPESRSLLTGLGTVSLLLLSVMSAVQTGPRPTLVMFAAGSAALALVGLGCGTAGTSGAFLVAKSCFPLLTALFILDAHDRPATGWLTRAAPPRMDVSPGGEQTLPWSPATPAMAAPVQARRWSTPLLLATAALASGIYGHEAVLRAAWERRTVDAVSPAAAEQEALGPGDGAGELWDAPRGAAVPLSVPLVTSSAYLLLCFGLFRSRFRAQSARPRFEPPAGVQGQTLGLWTALIVGLAWGPVLSSGQFSIAWLTSSDVSGPASMAYTRSPWPFGISTLLMLLGAVSAWQLYGRAAARPERLESALNAFAELGRRSFYVNDLAGWAVRLPVWGLAQMCRLFEWLVIERGLLAALSGIPRRMGANVDLLQSGSAAFYGLTLFLVFAVVWLALVFGQ